MACTWGSKVNGILTVVTIGIAVLVDLWDILDHKKGFSMVGSVSLVSWVMWFTLCKEHFWKHFMARAVGLIVVPFIIYLSFFYVHFAVLTHSGTGDAFMSPAFQETLIGNELLMNSQGLGKSPQAFFTLILLSQSFVTMMSSL